jgi:hypothetical protein
VKITKPLLRTLIKEEIEKLLRERTGSAGYWQAARGQGQARDQGSGDEEAAREFLTLIASRYKPGGAAGQEEENPFWAGENVQDAALAIRKKGSYKTEDPIGSMIEWFHNHATKRQGGKIPAEIGKTGIDAVDNHSSNKRNKDTQ